MKTCKNHPMRHRHGFTLIEMLIVIVIILILSGMLLKIMGLVGRRTAEARAEYELQQLKNALTEFYSEYGHYPPVAKDVPAASAVEYEYEAAYKHTQSAWFMNTFLPAHNDPRDPDKFFGDKEREDGDYLYAAKEGWNLGYRYGLASFLYKRDKGAQPHIYDRDTQRDSNAKDKWNHFIDDLHLSHGWAPHDPPPDIGSQAAYSNQVVSIHDPWGRSYRYECPPPFLGYRIWSAGADGEDGTPDDLNYDGN